MVVRVPAIHVTIIGPEKRLELHARSSESSRPDSKHQAKSRDQKIKPFPRLAAAAAHSQSLFRHLLFVRVTGCVRR